MTNPDPTLLLPSSIPVWLRLISTSLALFAMSTVAQEALTETILETWHDAKRDRDVPVKIYLPKLNSTDKKMPLIIFSHGLGGSREGYQFLGEHWAKNGFVSVHVQHIGSDDSVWKNAPKTELISAMRKAAGIKQYIDRPADVSFVLDQLEQYEALQNRINFEKIGMAGHSFGAHTTLAISGQVFQLFRGNEKSFADSRIKAAIAMSPQAPKRKATHDVAFSKIKIPMMHLTGTLDGNPLDPTMVPFDRQVPYQKINGASQYLIVFENGDHMIFSGRKRGPRDKVAMSAEELATFHQHIKNATLAFWKAWLNGDQEAKQWLKSETGLKAALGKTAAKFEQKHPDKGENR